MAEAALGTWIVTAIMGSYLFTYASDSGRPETGAMATHLPQLVLFLHPMIGLGGIAVWIAYLSTDSDILAWVAVAGLVVGGLIGGMLAALTERHRKTDTAQLTALAEHGKVDTLTLAEHTVAEQRIPRLATAAHGLSAALTFVLVLLVALRG